jgi:hypothetical protein
LTEEYFAEVDKIEKPTTSGDYEDQIANLQESNS